MKFNLSRELFLPALQIVNNVVERRQHLPILSNVLIHAEKGSITLVTTDMEVESLVRIDAPVEKTGSMTLPARKLMDICRALPPEAEVRVNVQEEKAKLQSGRSRFSLVAISAQEFPNIGSFDSTLELELDVGLLRGLIESTQFAMAHQDVRYYLNGLLFELRGNEMRAVATDGHRLAMCTREVELEATESHDFIVPRKGVIEIARLLTAQEDNAKLIIGTNHLKVVVPGQEVTTKLVDGRFPEYERVIPREGDRKVIADREDLRAGLSRASILSNEKFRGVRIMLSQNMLKAVAHNPEQEEAEEEMEVEYSGDELEVGFNVSYLLDVLGAMRSEKVSMDFIDANSSCLMRSPDDPGVRYVVMPMRI